MSQPALQATLTQHAMLVVWGQFAQHLDLIEALDRVPLHQKVYTHRPQTKVLELLLAILAGLPHLKEISHGAHPLDQDAAVARAWGQPAWADASGVSRTLQTLTPAEAAQIAEVLGQISQPFIDREVVLALRDPGQLVYDGDLTGRPVSNTSTTYPNVAYGHMSDAVRLGYQAALVSMHSPTYGRLWLAVTPHPGNTVSCTQAAALVQAAEATTGVRPQRRLDLLRQRIAALGLEQQRAEAHLAQQQQTLANAQVRLAATAQRISDWQHEVARCEAGYQARQCPERPHSRLAQARGKLAVQVQRQERETMAVAWAQRRLAHAQTQVRQLGTAQAQLTARLSEFEQDNATNPAPITAIFRLDGGFGTGENVALLIELGYEVYTKPYSHQVTARLRRQVSDATVWTDVGGNAELVAWASVQIHGCPYRLDVALERFHTGTSVRYSTLLHYGRDAVTEDLPGWLRRYNARQTIEAGIKEGKQVFQMHHLKVRAAPALLVQEHGATFAANFVRWAAHWLTTQCWQLPSGASGAAGASVTAMVRVGTHTSAWVELAATGWLVRFTDQSVYADRMLQTGEWVFQLPLPLFKSCDFSSA